eukprot:569475-Pelagomonas_calceolata.AAC.2
MGKGHACCNGKLVAWLPLNMEPSLDMQCTEDKQDSAACELAVCTARRSMREGFFSGKKNSSSALPGKRRYRPAPI